MSVPGGGEEDGDHGRGEHPMRWDGCSRVLLGEGGVSPCRLGGLLGRVGRGNCSDTALHRPPLPVLGQILREGAESSRHQLLIEAFVSAGRVDNITMVMGLHPQYLSSFWKTQYLLLRMDGPLPYHKRHYIAIMVRMWGPLGVWGSLGCGVP